MSIYHCMDNKVDFDKSCYHQVPVVDGAFTLGQALSKEAKEQVNITLDYNQILTEFEYIPCSQLYSLTFGDSFITLYMDTNTIRDMWLSNMESSEAQRFDYDNYNMMTTKSYNNYDKNYTGITDPSPIHSLTIRDEQLVQQIMTIPQELLDNIRVKLDNGQIADKDGVLYGV